MKKKDLLHLLQDMPDEIDAEDFIYRVFLRDEIERAEAAVSAGDVVPHTEVEKMIDEWLK